MLTDSETMLRNNKKKKDHAIKEKHLSFWCKRTNMSVECKTGKPHVISLYKICSRDGNIIVCLERYLRNKNSELSHVISLQTPMMSSTILC